MQKSKKKEIKKKKTLSPMFVRANDRKFDVFR